MQLTVLFSWDVCGTMPVVLFLIIWLAWLVCKALLNVMSFVWFSPVHITSSYLSFIYITSSSSSISLLILWSFVCVNSDVARTAPTNPQQLHYNRAEYKFSLSLVMASEQFIATNAEPQHGQHCSALKWRNWVEASALACAYSYLFL